MVRIILGVIAGFVVWSIFWIGSEALLIQLSPGWYGKHYSSAEAALMQGTTLESEPLINIVNLIRSFLTSMAAGYMAALIAGEYRRTTMVLGVILIAVGIAVEYMFWNLAPAWYHVLFVLFLLPMAMLGGRLRRPN